MSNTHIITCDCENKYQDKKYGKGNRVANQIKKMADVIPVVRCTVCGKERGAR